MIRRLLFFVLVCFFFFSSNAFVFAQSLGGGTVAVNLSPSNPGPNQSVTLALTSYSFSLQTAEIDWSIDGGKIVGGIGYSKYTITTKAIGRSTRVDITVTPIGSIPITQTVTIVPASVDLLWEATDSTVPPFYKGKALATAESAVKFVAIPQVVSGDGSLVPSSDFLYEWRDEYNPDDAHSGFGKNSFTTSMDYLNPTRNIGVDVSGRDGVIAATNDIALDPSDPMLALYAVSPLYGALYDHQLGADYTVTDTDTSIMAMPYYFSPGNPTSSQLAYTWSLNGNTVETPGIPNMLYLHRGDASTGDASVNLSLVNSTKLLQELTADLTLHLQ